MKLGVLIPAFRPDERLSTLVKDLSAADFNVIVIVNDGSGPAFDRLFDSLKQYPNVRVLRHPENRGKGEALKSGFRYLLEAHPDNAGVITADADGQHHPDDILSVAARFRQTPDALILGTRSFEGPVPPRSRAGNLLTRISVRLLVGTSLRDTQTGLRAVPLRLLPTLLRLPSSGYDFELDMLIACKHQACSILEQPIRTIYEDGNRSSHFNPLLDSVKIYFVLLRFTIVSLLTTLLGNIVFFLVLDRGAGLPGAQIAGRIAAMLFNYRAVRGAVFLSDLQHRVALPKYIALVCVSGAVSYGLIQYLMSAYAVPVLAAKLLVESVLFLGDFYIQRDFIFTSSGNSPKATDWDAYYSATPFTARLTRRYTASVLVRLIRRFLSPGPARSVIEIGGANSCFFDRIAGEVAPGAYHVIDTNQYGLDLLRRRAPDGESLILHRHSVLDDPLDLRADLVFSVGLIEHFTPEETARAVQAHFQLLKPGGCAIVSFPTPTLLYRVARSLTEAAGLWKFHDERPLTREEVLPVISLYARVLHEQVLWPLVFTQRIVVARKNS